MRTILALLLAMPLLCGAATPAKPADTAQTAVLAGGCFWGVEAVFERVRGVRKVVSGYSGGDKKTAYYPAVGTGLTGHAEVVQITYDPKEVSYAEILRIFFAVAHDPTQLNRQGPDTGPQYRSAIFYSSDAERDLARSYIKELDKTGTFRGEIVTRVDPLKAFYPAESYHQDFIAKNPNNAYVMVNDLPKIKNLKRLYPEYYREISRK